MLDNVTGDIVRNYIMPAILCLLIGFLLSKFLLNQYQNRQTITPVFNNSGKKLYFIQYGVYSTEENMRNQAKNLNYYIYHYDNQYYYVFVGITSNVENVEKLKGYFKNLGYDTYVKEFFISNKEFLEIIEYYDLLLEKTSDNDTIKAVCRQVLEKYEEIENNEHQN